MRQQRHTQENTLCKDQVLKRNCKADPKALESNRRSSVDFNGFWISSGNGGERPGAGTERQAVGRLECSCKETEEANRSTGLEGRCKSHMVLFVCQRKITCKLAWVAALGKENGGRWKAGYCLS